MAVTLGSFLNELEAQSLNPHLLFIYGTVD